MSAMCHSPTYGYFILSDLPLPSLPRVYDTEAKTSVYFLVQPGLVQVDLIERSTHCTRVPSDTAERTSTSSILYQFQHDN